MMDWLFWLAVIAAVLVLGSLAALWSYGRFARRAVGPPSRAIAPGVDGRLDRLVAPLEAAHPGQNGAMFLFDAGEAFAVRLHTAAMARRSLDLLYYIWTDDRAGRLLAHALLEAADRGVRVRLLLDDVNVLGRDPTYLALDRHPNVRVRLFNPIRARDNALRRGVELLFNLVRYNRRMHGKAWIADGRLAVVGGRNVGDIYFGAGTGRKRNVDDIDMLLAGPVVRAAAAVFDAFWNSGQALPISALWTKRMTSLPRFRLRLNGYVRNPAVKGWLARLGAEGRGRAGVAAAGLAPAGIAAADAALSPQAADATLLPLERLLWSTGLSFVADPPEKALGTRRAPWLPEAITPALMSAQSRLRIMTPYFVPGAEGLASLLDLAGRGVRVDLVTNALAVADHVTVHGAYRWYRKPLIAAGVRLYEFAARHQHRGWPAPPREMLHGKAFLVDDRLAFVGSFNFDMRSAFLNTEMGVRFDDPRLIAELDARFDRSIAPDKAYRLTLDGTLIGWRRGAGAAVHLEPDSTLPRRVVSFLIGHLPVHRWL